MSKGAIKFTEPSLTVKSAGGETDINSMVARARATGQWLNQERREPMYVDCTIARDYQTALERVRAVEDVFDGLGSAVRDRFANRPLKMVEFLLDPKNREEGERLGLLKPKAEEPKK